MPPKHVQAEYDQSGLAALALALIAPALPGWAKDGGDHDEHESHARLDGKDERAQIEPNAGAWRPWVISSGRDYRVAPPPGHKGTKAELRLLAELMSHNDAQVQQQIAFWDAGRPASRS